MSKITGSCGDEILKEENWYKTTAVMSFSDEGERAVEYVSYCEQCLEDYEKAGIILHSIEEINSWMAGEFEYPIPEEFECEYEECH